MKILIAGINGMLGTELAQVLSSEHTIEGLTEDKSFTDAEIKVHYQDICAQKPLYDTITKINPDLVINTAAVADVDGCEKNPDLAYKVNALGARNIALACQRFDTQMLHISTDYVFSGRKQIGSGYTEFDSPDPVSVYAKSKSAGEGYVKRLLNKYYIVRPAWLFGHKRANFVSNIAEALVNGKEIKCVSDMVSSATNVKDLSIAVSELIGTGKYGTYHITNSGFASRYEIAETIAKMLGAPVKYIKKLTLKELHLPAERPSFSGLNNYLWKLEGFKALRSWQDAVREFLKEKNY